MQLTDLFVIYLACGAPFGAYRIVKSDPRQFSNWLAGAFTMAAWLPYLFLFGFSRVMKRRAHAPRTAREDGDGAPNAGDLRLLVSALLEPGAAGAFVSATERYEGLFKSFDRDHTRNDETPEAILIVDDHPAPLLGSLCIRRMNRRKLKMHIVAARKEILVCLSQLDLEKRANGEIRSMVNGFFKAFDDAEAVASAEALFDRSASEERECIQSKQTDLPHTGFRPDTRDLPTASRARTL